MPLNAIFESFTQIAKKVLILLISHQIIEKYFAVWEHKLRSKKFVRFQIWMWGTETKALAEVHGERGMRQSPQRLLGFAIFKDQNQHSETLLHFLRIYFLFSFSIIISEFYFFPCHLWFFSRSSACAPVDFQSPGPHKIHSLLGFEV